jgi:hypothetical protein
MPHTLRENLSDTSIWEPDAQHKTGLSNSTCKISCTVNHNGQLLLQRSENNKKSIFSASVPSVLVMTKPAAVPNTTHSVEPPANCQIDFPLLWIKTLSKTLSLLL